MDASAGAQFHRDWALGLHLGPLQPVCDQEAQETTNPYLSHTRLSWDKHRAAGQDPLVLALPSFYRPALGPLPSPRSAVPTAVPTSLLSLPPQRARGPPRLGHSPGLPAHCPLEPLLLPPPVQLALGSTGQPLLTLSHLPVHGDLGRTSLLSGKEPPAPQQT